MGPTETPTVVLDAGPLIHLDELKCLDLLADFPSVLVPDEVWNEVRRHRPQALEIPPFKLQRRTVPPAPPNFAALFKAFSLGAGEQSALVCLSAIPDAILLTDDAAARLVAQAFHLRAHGTVGILLRSIRRGQRSRAEILDLLRRLPDISTLHLRSTLRHQIIEEVTNQED
ncbi:MAG TPA: DNA-binding protein [Thermoanaerobaculia bacterium]|nr:DNA-binding protein [Thermoanaerobaculia bacterium]